MNILELKEVTKTFGKRVILDDVSLTVEEGDIFGLIGQSGSGKTTLLNLLVGFYQPTEGKVSYQIDPHKKPKEVSQHLSTVKKTFGFASQVSSFYPKLTVNENLLHFGHLYGIKKPVLKGNIKSLLTFTELLEHKNRLSEHISVGMQKRLDLSCSLIHKPKVLILDEPTADLDPVLQKEILHLIKQSNKQGITIIIASHHLNDIEHICNKVALIHKGKLVHSGTVEEIKKPYLQKEGAIHFKVGEFHHKMIGLLEKLPLKRIVDKKDSLVIYSSKLQNTLHQLISLAQKEHIPLLDLDIKKPTLQDVFEKIVKNQPK